MPASQDCPLLMLLLVTVAAGCRSPYYADQGAAVGAVTGALTGAAIGDASGNAGAGAVIGTAVGALTGNAIGESIDQDVARSQAIIEERMGRQMASAVTIPDVIAMTQAGLGDGVIQTHIRAYGVAHPLGVGDLITLRNAGVSDPVIQAMQQTPPPTAVVPAPQPVPVIVEEHYHAPPPWRSHWNFHHGHPLRRRHRPGVSWGVSFSN